MEWQSLRKLLGAHYQLIGVLIGAFLVLVSMGTYTNWDAQTEFEAASSVVTRGFPYVTTGLIIDQPPLAFYMTAPVLKVFGLSYLNGVNFVTALGLGCIVLVYALGTLLYGKRTGLVSAALFGLVPWQVFMARIYLIDVQYMFLSLLFLLIGILAIKKTSEKLLAVSGVLFALAFLTKLFTVFLLIPLLLMALLNGKESGFKLTLRKVLIFLVPSFIFQAVWFGGFGNQHFFGVYVASDFTHRVLITDPALTFLPRIYVESTGWFLLAAAMFSMVLAVSLRHSFEKTLQMDFVCAVTILAVAAVDLGLVFGLNLLVPYVSAFKYNYAALPFLCLLAASSVNKGGALIDKVESKRKIRLIKRLLVGVGLVLLFASLVENIVFLYGWSGFVAFEVDSNGHYFPFDVYSPPVNSRFFEASHYAAIAIITISLAFPFIVRGLKRSSSWLSTVLSN